MMLRHSFGREEEAARVEAAVRRVLADGWRTPDIAEPEGRTIGTVEMGRRVVQAIGS
jgi:3-isopropylmalate dehydrogenase